MDGINHPTEKVTTMTATDIDLDALRYDKLAAQCALSLGFVKPGWFFEDKPARAREFYDTARERLGVSEDADVDSGEAGQTVEQVAEEWGYPPTPDPPRRPPNLQRKKAVIICTLACELEDGGPFYGQRGLYGRMVTPAMDRVLDRARHALPAEVVDPNHDSAQFDRLVSVVHRAARELGLRGDRGCGR